MTATPHRYPDPARYGWRVRFAEWLVGLGCRHPAGTVCRHNQWRYDVHGCGYGDGYRSGTAHAETEQRGERAADDPQFDGTDGAHPAWWRGCDYGYAKGRAEHAALREKARAVVNVFLDTPASLAKRHVSAIAALALEAWPERAALDEVKG